MFTVLLNPLLNVENFGVQVSRWRIPLPIEVIPRQVCAIIAESYSINIYNRHNLKDELTAKLFSFDTVTQKCTYEPLEYERRGGLSCMLPCYHIDDLLCFALYL